MWQNRLIEITAPGLTRAGSTSSSWCPKRWSITSTLSALTADLPRPPPIPPKKTVKDLLLMEKQLVSTPCRNQASLAGLRTRTKPRATKAGGKITESVGHSARNPPPSNSLRRGGAGGSFRRALEAPGAGICDPAGREGSGRDRTTPGLEGWGLPNLGPGSKQPGLSHDSGGRGRASQGRPLMNPTQTRLRSPLLQRQLCHPRRQSHVPQRPRLSLNWLPPFGSKV